MQLRVLWFGRPAASPYEEQVAVYRKRISYRWPAADQPLRPEAGRGRGDQQRMLAAEAARVRGKLPRGWPLVALDERGTSLDSRAFAALLARHEEEGISGLCFVLGSDLGLDQSLRREASRCLSLSAMTLPHLLARLCLWEQLYRATDILGSGRYHRLGVQ